MAKEYHPKLADIILLGMYTGCHLGELAHMLKEDVNSDRFNISVSEMYSGIRSILIDKGIMQVVERMTETSTDEYLICGHGTKNQQSNRGNGIDQKFMRHTVEQSFQKKKHTLHGFHYTLAILFQSAGAEELFVPRSIGQKAGRMINGPCACDLDWDNAVKVMAKIYYQRAA